MEINANDKKIIYAFFLLLAFVILIRTAWICDDAAISFRAVMNFINGYGPVFNVGERVQVYTNPLWFICITCGTLILRHVYLVAYILSIILSLLTLWLLISKARITFWQGIIAGSGLLLSKAFIDFSTSGLENPLSHFILIAGFCLGFKYFETKNEIFAKASLIVLMLIYLCRPDLILLVLPFAFLIIKDSHRSIKSSVQIIFIALLTLVIWTIFSLIYYGFPFPNPAYVKLGGAIPVGERLSQGIIYLMDSLLRDPITLGLISIGVLLSFAQGKELRAIAWGILLYLVYIVIIGGDFMSGRFLTSCLLASAVIIARTKMSSYSIKALGILIALLGLMSLKATLLSDKDYAKSDFDYPKGIADERHYYFQEHSLANATRDFFKEPEWRLNSKNVIVNNCGWLGYSGMNEGPGTYIIDICGLEDPLIARLPARNNKNWRIGHMTRQLPTNYINSIWRDKNLLPDKATHDYWEVIRLITRGPILNVERFKRIIQINLGLMAKPDESLYKNQEVPSQIVVDKVVFNLSDADQNISLEGSPWDDLRNIQFGSELDVRLKAPTRIGSIRISLNQGNRYNIAYLSNGNFIPLVEFGNNERPGSGMVWYQSIFKEPTSLTDTLRITNVAGNGNYSIGNLMLNFEGMLLFDNSDFERGDLRNWTATGDAFLNQPTLGDNSLYRKQHTSNMQGQYWIGTAENRQTTQQPLGNLQGDGPLGTLTSIPFTIQRNKIDFLIGGGDSTSNESVALRVDGKKVLEQDGWGNTTGNETMERVFWDVSRWKGRKAQLIITDNSSGPWGHINVDDFRYWTTSP